MSARKITEPVKNERGDETHPAFGVATVTRGQGTGRTLFQSDLQHTQTITLSVHTATRGRDLNRDWVHPRETLVEIEMSLAQWGALISSAGIGSGVPVTLRRTESTSFVDALPYQPRIAQSLAEVNAAMGKTMARIRQTYTVVQEAFEQKKGIRAMREALSAHHAAITHTEANTGYAVKSLKDAAESVTSQTRADIEALILEASRQTGLDTPVEVPALDAAPEAIEVATTQTSQEDQ